MGEGAFAVGKSPRVEWGFECERYPDGWEDSQYAIVPTLDVARRELTVPVWLAFVVFSVLTAIFLRRERIAPGYCQHCGYDLTGNVSGRCPECGEAI